MKEFFKSLFGASSKEVMGFSFLIIVLVISLIVPRVFNKLTAKDASHWAEDEKTLDSLVALLEKEKKPGRKIAKVPVDLHYFNPNEAPYPELLTLGFSEKIARRIINYREKGGSFKIRKDLYKIYDIDSSLVTELYNYIELPEKVKKSSVRKITYAESKKKPPLVAKTKHEELPDFDINKVDTSTLQTIKGIGSVLSKRIIDFRDNLGGFIIDDQLYEVYNLDSAVVMRLLTKMYIEDNFSPEKLFINQVNEKELAGHPYISWQQARLIIAYRSQHGDYRVEEDLLKVYAIEENDVQRIASYLDWTPSN